MSTAKPQPAEIGWPLRPGRVVLFFAIAAVLIGVSHLVDPLVTERVRVDGVNDTDWGRMLRSAGYVPTWFVVSLALVLIDHRFFGLSASRPSSPVMRDAWTRGVLLVSGAVVSGALAELVKLLVRRERPGIVDGETVYAFRSFTDGTFSTSGLGMTSSHTAVAFGAAFVLCRLHPSAMVVWVGLGVGCGMTRVLSGAHFVSDTVAAMFLGYGVAWGLWRWHILNCSRDKRRAIEEGSA